MMDPVPAKAENKHRKHQKIYLVLPAYNEEHRIAILLDRIDEAMHEASLPYQVILVDDGSRDATAKIVTEYAGHMPIMMMQHKVNLGLGATLRDGLVAAMEIALDRDIIVTMDADDTHAPGLILRMVRMIREGHDVVIASRFQRGARTLGVPPLRRFMSFSASILLRFFFPTPGVRDFTSGYRAYRAEVIKQAISQYGKKFLNQDGFQCMVDILLKLRKMNIIFGEAPLILRYDFKKGASKMNVIQTAVNTLLLIFKRRFRR